MSQLRVETAWLNAHFIEESVSRRLLLRNAPSPTEYCQAPLTCLHQSPWYPRCYRREMNMTLIIISIFVSYFVCPFPAAIVVQLDPNVVKFPKVSQSNSKMNHNVSLFYYLLVSHIPSFYLFSIRRIMIQIICKADKQNICVWRDFHFYDYYDIHTSLSSIMNLKIKETLDVGHLHMQEITAKLKQETEMLLRRWVTSKRRNSAERDRRQIARSLFAVCSLGHEVNMLQTRVPQFWQ